VKNYVELVKKWLANNDSVTLEELKANEEAAWAAYWADDDTYRAASWATRAAYWTAEATYWAAYWADDDTYWAAVWAAESAYYKQQAIEAIEKYGELTK